MRVDLKTMIYAGLFVTPESKEQLEIAFCSNVEDGALYLQNNKKYIDHCTMIFNDGNFDDAQSENILEYLKNCPDNTHFMLTVDGIGKYESVYAFRVKRTESVVMLVKNKQPHITCVLNPKVNKPVDSNKITEWIDIEPIKVDTICSIRTQNRTGKK